MHYLFCSPYVIKVEIGPELQGVKKIKRHGNAVQAES